MKITMYELLGMVKDETVDYKYVKYFDRVNEKDDVMLACAENIIYKLDHSNIELNDKVEFLEEPKGIPKKLGKIDDNDGYIDQNDVIKIGKKVDEILDYLESKENLMNDEIKENNTPNHILSALGDLTNGAINYYQLPKTTLEEQKMILDYITNLQTIEREYSSLLSENAELQQENDRLNNIINELERRFNQELELNNKWEVEDTQKFYSKKWYRDVLRDFKNMIKELKEQK